MRAYYHIAMSEENISKTAVMTPFGLFEFIRMPFGLRNARQTFQRFMDKVLRGLNFAFVYIDDVLVASISIEEHKRHLELTFDRSDSFGITINPDKCVLASSHLEFLGHRIGSNGIRPLKEKATAILEYSVPQSIKGFRRFLRTVSYYAWFIPNCSEILSSLTDLLKSNAKTLQLNTDVLHAFDSVKYALSKVTSLSYLHLGVSCTLILKTDASQSAVGAALQQVVGGAIQPLRFLSRKLKSAQTRYSTFSRELLAIYLAVKHSQHILEGRDFIIYTDHKPLTFALRTAPDKHAPRENRYLDFISQFSTDIRYIQGSHNVVADALSRCTLHHISDSTIDLVSIAVAQKTNPQYPTFSNLPHLKFVRLPLLNSDEYIICDVSTGTHPLFVPPDF